MEGKRRRELVRPISPQERARQVENTFNSYVSDFHLTAADLSEPLLDVGASSGNFIQHVRSLGNKDAYGVERFLERARAPHGRQEGMVVADAHAMPFADGQFNLVISRGEVPIFYKDQRPENVTDEMLRVLKPGGRLIFETSTIDHIDAGVKLNNDAREKIQSYPVTEEEDARRSAGVRSFFLHLEELQRNGYVVSQEPISEGWVNVTIHKPNQ